MQQISLNRRRNEDKGKTKTYQSRPENKSQKERKIKLIKKKFTKNIYELSKNKVMKNKVVK